MAAKYISIKLFLKAHSYHKFFIQFSLLGNRWATPSGVQNLHMALSLEVFLRDYFAMLGIELRVVMYKKNCLNS